MTDKVSALLDQLADNAEEIDGLVDEREAEANELTYKLLTSLEERDPDVFALFEADPQLTLEDFHLVPVIERDIMWSAAFASLVAAVRMQVWSEVFGIEMLGVIEAENEAILKATKSMNTTELSKAAKEGISKERFKNAKAKRQQRATEKTEG